MTFSFAEREDESAIAKLLEQSGLPTSDLPQKRHEFIVARDNGRVVGVVGLESKESCGLLRSLAVAPSCRGKNLGLELYQRITEHARSRGVETLYLLTTTADRYFSKLGFSQIGRMSMPESIKATEQFTSLCPASSVCMKKRIV